MDLLKSHKHRSRVSEVVYVLLNLGLALALFIIVIASQSPWLAFLLVLVSKFRTLLVRPRFWMANLIANLPDTIVGLSVVVLLYAASGAMWLQIVLAMSYAAWLLLIKPRSQQMYVAAQAGVAVFFGVTALSIVSFGWSSIFFVGASWVIGYVAARHILSSYDEPHAHMISLVMALIFAELAWISYHWLFAYTLPGFGDVKLSQFALFITLLGVVAERAYVSYAHFGRVRKHDILLPGFLAASLIVIMLAFFSSLVLSSGSI